MRTLRQWTLQTQTATGVDLSLEGQHILRIAALENDLFRVSLKKEGAWRQPRTWSIAPNGDTPWEGRDRDDLSGFDGADLTVMNTGGTLILSTPTVRVTISEPLHLKWEAQINGAWRVFAQDRPTGSLMLGRKDHSHGHFLNYDADAPVHGLGEKAGNLDRRGRRFEMRNLDALGYDAETTDPLYKHIPVTMTQTPSAGAWSIFYDNLASCWFDIGNEIDNYHRPYRSYRAEDGDLDYYMRWSPDILGLVKGHVRLTGGTCFTPRWSLGYSGSTMSYTDAPNAQDQLIGFTRDIDTHDIPCDSFQLSSGYSSINGKRYVFTWNTDKIPDVMTMTGAFKDASLHLIANIKPCLLHDHPRYDEAAAMGLFVRDSETNEPEQSMFWDDIGSHLDFTNPDTINWWQSNVTEQLLEKGIESTWNDNNEYEIWDREAQCNGFGTPIDISLIRPLHCLLMTRASRAAQQAFAPDKRPYAICRSGSPGIQRYAQSWSGDNRTDWKTLRYNIRMGLGMSLSGLFNTGHDVGGFAGPRPGPDLFVRWVQNGIFHPRFTIHSWNDDYTANEPWMYPEVTHHIRDAIRLRYRLMPYLYTLLHQAVTEDEPMLRPLFLDHPDDPLTWAESDDFMLGRDLLVANVVDKDATSRTVRLPDNGTGWWDFDTGIWHAPGTIVTKDVDLGSIPLFVRAGAILPLSKGGQRANPAADQGRVIGLFPAQDGAATGQLFEDDGETVDSPYSILTFELYDTNGDLALNITHAGSAAPTFDSAELMWPNGDNRRLLVNGSQVPDNGIVNLAQS